MTPTESFDLVDVFLPVGRTGVELLLGVDESHQSSEQRDSMYSLQDTMASRATREHLVAGVFVSADPVPQKMLGKALGRMGVNQGIDQSVIPLTVQQAKQVALLEADLFDVLDPMFDLVEAAVSRPKDDLDNAVSELLTNIAILVERHSAG